MNKVIICLIVSLFLFNCKKTKEDELFTYLTNDSISMWDITMKRLTVLSDTTYYHHYFRSYLFQDDFICESFAKTKNGIRLIDFLGPEPNLRGLCNKWEILNDSTVKLNCKNIFVIRKISRDTLHLIDTLGVKQHEMYRVQPPWNIDEESVKIRDKQVESGEYLDKRVY